MREHFNVMLDRLVRTEIAIGRRFFPAFALCGYAGFVTAVVLALVLTIHTGLSLGVLLVMTVVGALAYLAVVGVTRMITGVAALTYYHHEIAILAATGVTLRVMHQPVLAYLDITVLGIGCVLAFGRVGCLLVGCCHGRPHAWGVCYRPSHAARGFPVSLTGVRLFPIQAVELLMVVAVVVTGATHVYRGGRPGEALTWYIAIYGAGRFWLEFARGDSGRRYLAGFSEAQWTSAILMCAATAAEVAGLLAFHGTDLFMTAAVLVTMIAVAVRRRFGVPVMYRLRRADHLNEVADAIERALSAAADPTTVSRTSLGLQISAGCLDGFEHYALSAPAGMMSTPVAITLADLIASLRGHPSGYDVVPGGDGVVHLVAHATRV